jgi:hypothetical protein
LGSEGVPCSCTPHKRSVAFARCLIVVWQGPKPPSVPYARLGIAPRRPAAKAESSLHMCV